jgi:hypothetical protein
LASIPFTNVNTTNAPGPTFNYNATGTDYLIMCDGTGTGGTFLTITLPTSPACTDGRTYRVKRTNAGSSSNKCQVTPVATPASTGTMVLDAPDYTSSNTNSAAYFVCISNKWWLIGSGP